MFLAYIKDVPEFSDCQLFADDNLLYSIVNKDTEKSAPPGRHGILRGMGKWENTWQMTFNTTKYSVVSVPSGKRKKTYESYSLKLASCNSALSTPPPPLPRWFTLLSKAVVPVLIFVASWFIQRSDLFYVLPCVIVSCVFQSF